MNAKLTTVRLSLLWLVLLSSFPGAADGATFGIVWDVGEYEDPDHAGVYLRRLINREAEEHSRGEWEADEDDDPNHIASLPAAVVDEHRKGYQFGSPEKIYLDQNYQLTDGITDDTVWVGSHTEYSFRFERGLRYDGTRGGPGFEPGTILVAAFGNRPVSTFQFMSHGTVFVGGTVTWKFSLAPLPPNKIVIETAYGAGKVVPPVTAPYGLIDDNEVQTFTAPQYIYLNKDRVELDDLDVAPAGMPGIDNRAWYRARNIGYSIDGQVVQGGERFFERTIREDIKVTWLWELEYAVFIESATAEVPDLPAGFGNPDPGGFGQPSPGIGRQFYPKNTELTAAIDSVVAVGADSRFTTAGYAVFDEKGGAVGGTVSRSPDDVRSVTAPIIVNAPRRIRWLWDAQVLYSFDATAGLAGESPNKFAGQWFVRKNGGGPVFDSEVWVSTGSEVEVGAFYRTQDGCFTLADFNSPPTGDLADLGSDISDLTDTEAVVDDDGTVGRVSRIATVAAVEKPTKIHWFYKPTVYRAEIALGSAFDPDQLVPPLTCGTLADSGPEPGKLLRVGELPTGDAIGFPWRWDRRGRELFPVHPGSYRISWQDSNPDNGSYQIEIVSGYPGDPVDLVSEREQPNGKREVRPGTTDYVFTTSLAGVGGSYPAFPRAHYHHLADSDEGRRPPTKLDLSGSDEWAFQELTYSDDATKANVLDEVPGKGFVAENPGRSVLLYSYRPNPDEAADGNLDEERLAVRVVESSPVAPIFAGDPAFVLGRRGLELSDGLGVIKRGNNSVGTINPGANFVVDFWLDAKNLRRDAEPVKVFTTSGDGLNVTLDNHLSETTAEVDFTDPTIEVPFAFAGESDLRITNTRTGAVLVAGEDYTSPRGGSDGAPTGTIDVVGPMTTGTVYGFPDFDVWFVDVPRAFVSGPPLEVVNLTNSNRVLVAPDDYSVNPHGGMIVLVATEIEASMFEEVLSIDVPFRFTSGADLVVTNFTTGAILVEGDDFIVSPGQVNIIDSPATSAGDYLKVEQVNPAVRWGDEISVTRSNSEALDGDTLRIVGLNRDGDGTTVTAEYRGVKVSHPLTRAGNPWHHYVIHVFRDQFFNSDVTVVDFYVDGVRQEQGQVTSALSGTSGASTVATDVGDQSLRFGVDVEPLSGLQIDQFRMFDLAAAGDVKWLDAGELHQLRTVGDLTGDGLRGVPPMLWFSFENAPDGNSFANDGSLPDVGVGSVPPDPDGIFAGTWAHLGIQEVATRLDSTLDDAGFGGTGFILNRIANYNANLYTRDAEVGTWGPIFPVNDVLRYPAPDESLEVAYYENPYRQTPDIHPNVAWPYQAVEYDEIGYPVVGPHKDKAIYIASRIGSEGVDKNGRPQQIFHLSEFANLEIYNQADPEQPGFNPNEEHALVAPSGRAALKVKNLGEGLANNPPLAAFALQNDLNATSDTYTSDPWVLVQVDNLITGEPEMAAYQVFKVRHRDRPTSSTGVAAWSSSSHPWVDFPRPNDRDASSTPGLAYESATNPEDRFLTIDPSKTYQFEYKFDYPVLAGDLLIPPYPLNLVVGNVAMPDNRGGNIENADGVNQRSLWRDVNDNAWVVSGGGRFFHQFFYPFRSDFHLPGATPGLPVALLPAEPDAGFLGDFSKPSGDIDDSPSPVKIEYSSAWRSSYPKLKRGETLAYQGGEYFNENPGATGLPALVAMAAAEVVYDSSTPSMVLDDANLDGYSARVIRGLDRYEAPFSVAEMEAVGFKPGDDPPKLLIVAERWYFKKLSGSLQRRFYYDSLNEKLVFRGRLNDKESGDADLTSGPDPINVLEPNVLTEAEIMELKDLAAGNWDGKVQAIADLAANPNSAPASQASPPASYFAGVRTAPAGAGSTEMTTFWETDADGRLVQKGTQPASKYAPLDSFGAGATLVPNPALLKTSPDGSLYVTIAENNRTELDGAPVSLHIIEIIPDRYRGAIKVIEPADAFSEKVSLQHNGEFGANTGELYYEWWIRDAAPLDVVADEVLDNGNLQATDARGNTLWQQYLPAREFTDDELETLSDRLGVEVTAEMAKHLGLHSIIFEGRPDVTLADKLVLVRYKHVTEVDADAELSNDWTLVPFEVASPAVAWQPGTAAPFQWAGAANSPQLQADGSKRYIPQLVMGWVKRVLDRINPYEARYNDFFSNESPATYSSQIQIAGAPAVGAVALNPDKNVIENVGLIELYETVLARARALSIDNSSNGNASDGIQQALLLAATRLSVLYELLAREAYSDAQDSTITVTDDSDLASVSPFTHAFQNIEADVMHEELALLRGTDFRKSFPVYNRMFWNYAKGLGEAAYNINYNIYDENSDGFINEDDARALYPQGHGDAWGHYLSALGMHYTLLQHSGFKWQSRAELYSLMQNVLEVDFLDEKTFAKLAAGKARAGRDIVRGTYRLKYTQDPDGQWQGYTDGADPARAWGVSEWAHRSGQGALFDWAMANALLPDDADETSPVDTPENLDLLERSAAALEIGEVAAGLFEIQTAMDEANGGSNPLGFDSDAIAFDLQVEFYENTSGRDRRSHFEQILARAQKACSNAVETLGYSANIGNKLRGIGDDTDALIVEAFRQDLDFRNRLIEIFGRPYSGTIGFGKAYPEGYEGPDTLLFGYLDRTTINEIIPSNAGNSGGLDFEDIKVLSAPFTSLTDVASNSTLVELYNDAGIPTGELVEATKVFLEGYVYRDILSPAGLDLPVRRTSAYAFQAPQPAWGRRTSYGKVQLLLERMLQEEVALTELTEDYKGFLGDFHSLVFRLDQELERTARRESVGDTYETDFRDVRDDIRDLQAAASAARIAVDIANRIRDSAVSGVPGVLIVGFSNGGDVGAPARSALYAAGSNVGFVSNIIAESLGADIQRQSANLDTKVEALGRKLGQIDRIAEIEGILEQIENLSGSDGPKRAQIGMALQQLEITRQEYVTAQAEGFRILKEREAFNKILAASVQKNRYQDMLLRLSRNEAMSKYQSAFTHAARYAWLAAKAYDYETSLDPGHPAAATQVFDQIVRERQLGLWVDGEPQIGKGGLAELLAQLSGNFQVFKGQLGIDNPQSEIEKISLRSELFRIMPGVGDPEVVDLLAISAGNRTIAQQARIDQAVASDGRWEGALKARIVPDLTAMPEFVRHCRPFSSPEEGPQPGIVIRFSSRINNGVNFFGNALTPGDHAYSTANFATKIRGVGVWLENYNESGLSTTPRAYIVPVGNDYLRTSSSAQPITRRWSVSEQRIPTPYVINQGQLTSPEFIPSLDGVEGGFGDLRRHGNFRMYHDNGDLQADDSELTLDTRLIGRSVWNSEWLLIIPGAGLHADPDSGLEELANHVSDIKLHFQTYSHQGQ